MMKTFQTASLYDAKTVDTLDWPETQEGDYAKRFLKPLVKNGVHHYIDNIFADAFALKVDNLVLPLILPQMDFHNSYVCSPYQHYITYGLEHVNLIQNRPLQTLVKFLIAGLGKLGQAGRIDSVIYVNNWLFSTDPYPQGLSLKHLIPIVDLLKNRFPDRAIVFRSLNSITTPSELITLKKLGFHLISSRHVFITDAKKEEIFKTRIFKSDLKLLRETSYEIIDESELTLSDCSALLALERDLYVIHHSPLQPQMNQEFMELLFQQNLFRFKILKLNGVIKGVAGYFQLNGVMYCPFMGFEKEDPDHNVIYRLLNTCLLLEAKSSAHFFNQSAGASFYKSIRRAEGCQEHMAVYTRHLPLKQRVAWSQLSLFINTVAPRYMRKKS